MKYSTLQKVTMTALAMVASLALTAQAGNPSLRSAVRTHGATKSINPIHSLLFPASTYMIDDGTAEDSVGFGDGSSNSESLWFNQFDVVPGQTSIGTVSIVWGTPVSQDNINGTQVTIAVWSDPNGDGNPSDAALLGSMPGTIQNAGTDTFVDYTFSTPVELPAGATSFFVGDMTPANSGPQHFFQGIDQNSTLHRQSWISANGTGDPVDLQNPGNNDLIGLIDDFGLPGNWLIRADAGGSTGGEITLAAKARRQGGNRLVALSWTPADGGSINILRDGEIIGTTDDDGGAQDHLGGIGGETVVYTYQVCEPDTGVCSNEVRIKVRGTGL